MNFATTPLHAPFDQHERDVQMAHVFGGQGVESAY
jgi:hypothetical protein